MRKFILFILLIAGNFSLKGQETSILSFSEYVGYVKMHHPIVKQANLVIKESEAKLLKARGAFDPKLEVNYDEKKFKGTEYINKLNAAFKIPTWYGIELMGNFEENTGEYINPEAYIPKGGLYSVGVEVPLANGLLINERMATLKQAKLFQEQSEVDNQLLVNNILYKAVIAYFNWLKKYQEKQIYDEFLINAELRQQGIKKSYMLGDKPAIDTIEARITVNSRKLSQEKATLNYIKASLELSNYLWIDNVPVELQGSVIPDNLIMSGVDKVLELDDELLSTNILNHPKLQSLELKKQRLEVDKRLSLNNLLPKVYLKYNLLTTTPDTFSKLTSANYKAGLAINVPLFLRKERANLKLANYKLQAIDFDNQTTRLALKNKLISVNQEIISYQNQIDISRKIVSDYKVLLQGEKRKFNVGESSLFIINSRESKLIENKLKLITLENMLLNTKGKLFNLLGN